MHVCKALNNALKDLKKGMIDMHKTVIAPIVAVLVMAIQLIFGVKIPESLANEVVVATSNVVAVLVAIYGIFKNHQKEKSASMPDDVDKK